MQTHRNEHGFGHVLSVVLIAVVLAAIAFVGVKVVETNNSVGNTTASLPYSSAAVPTAIKTKADLRQAQRALDTTTAPDPGVLDNDLKNLL